MTASIVAKGLQEFVSFVERLPELATEAAYFSLVDVTRDTQPLLRKRMQKQINFPNGYLDNKRLFVKHKPTRASLEAVISGRDRPTSLARFAQGATIENSRKRPIIVKVKANKQRTLQKAFLIPLRSGNVGLAIRLPEGQTPDRAYKPVQLTRRGGQIENVWLLYGPSVDQVLKGVSDDVGPEIQAMLSRNFLRQFSRLTRG